MSKYHNRGQEDASGDKFEPPHERPLGPIGELIDPLSDKEIEDRKDYRAGWRHTKDQKDSSSGFCFLTSACVEYAGLPDTCHELQVLRRFRDGYVRRLAGGDEMIREYYAVGPTLVSLIKGSPDRRKVLGGVLKRIRDAVVLIEAGRLEDALRLYSRLFRHLARRYKIVR